MSLPWFRMDCHIGSHDKILALLNIDGAKAADKWQAFASYICAIGWSVDHSTDGRIPKTALPFVHGTLTTARLLVIARLWQETSTGWQVVNFGDRQQLTAVTEAKKEIRRASAEKANCKRWHGEKCWTDEGCSRER